MIEKIEIKQRSDYTFKYNKKLGRHGWLRLTPAYSVKLVDEIAKEYSSVDLILEPFSGTATTSLVLAEQGIKSVAFDINPFLVWFGSTKTKNYTVLDLEELNIDFEEIIQNAAEKVNRKKYWLPEIFNIERWWDPHTLKVLSAIHHELETRYGCPPKSGNGDLIWVAFCRLIIETSSAAFNHVSMSFKDGVSKFEFIEVASLFSEIFNKIMESAKESELAASEIRLNDSRNNLVDSDILFNGVITSPPYPNRISYIRELRPYMYWTKFINVSREAGEIDWSAIGGTWGIATSNLNSWKPINTSISESLDKSVSDILAMENKNSQLMAKYVHKYFDDMFEHFQSIRKILAKDASLNYIIGNSTFYGVEVKSDIIYMDILKSLGFRNVTSKIVRKRNSKKGLFEYLVKAKK